MANDFTYYAPTKVVFGKGAETHVGKLVKEQNCKKFLFIMVEEVLNVQDFLIE